MDNESQEPECRPVTTANTGIASIVLTLIATFGPVAALADTVIPGRYFLLDHPDGSISPPPYGLRLDIVDPPNGVGPTFSVTTGGASVVLDWDGGTTATIRGSIYNNETGNLWTLEHILTDISVLGGNNGGFTAANGTMTVGVAAADVALYGASTFTFFSVPAGGEAFVAAGDDHRCGNRADCGPQVARGWLKLTGEPLANGGATVEDWLVQLTPVPLPAAAWLLLTGLAGLRVGAHLSRRCSTR